MKPGSPSSLSVSKKSYPTATIGCRSFSNTTCSTIGTARSTGWPSTLGGEPLSSDVTEEAQSEEEQLFQSILAKAATAYVNQQYDEALPLIEKAITLKPATLTPGTSKGVTLGHLGRHEDALRALNQALALNDTHALAAVNKGMILSMLGRYEEAITAHERAAVLDPGNFFRGWERVWLWSNWAVRKLLWRHLRRRSPSIRTTASRGRAKGERWPALDRHEAAQRAFQVAVERLPQDSAVWVARAKTSSSSIATRKR